MCHQLNRYCLNGTCCVVLSLCVRVCFLFPFACDFVNIGLWAVKNLIIITIHI
jgi:hypothetical protein